MIALFPCFFVRGEFYIILLLVFLNVTISVSDVSYSTINSVIRDPSSNDNTYKLPLLIWKDYSEVSVIADKKYMHGPAFKQEILAGLISALATIPTSISYATIVGLNPLTGIWTSAILGFCLSLWGGSPGMIAGAAGVVAIPLSKLISTYGYGYMSVTVIVAAALEIAFGVAKLGKLADLVTSPIMAGFLNAFAVFLVKSQFKIFKSYTGAWLPQSQLQPAIAIATLSIIIIKFLPRLTTSIPSSLVGIIIPSLLSVCLALPVKYLKDIAAKEVFSGGLAALPTFIGLPSKALWNIQTLKIVLPTALGIAMISLLETLLAMKLMATLRGSKTASSEREDSNQASIGLGIGTSISSLFGGFGGCGLIPNTLLNGKSGGTQQLSTLSYAVFLSLAVLVFAPLIANIPLAALGGLMLTIAFNTFEWKETFHLLKHTLTSVRSCIEVVAMLVAMCLCIKIDMGLGVLAGTALIHSIPLVENTVRALSKKFQ